MIIQFHTKEGIIERDANEMTQKELEALGAGNLHRINKLLSVNPSTITLSELTELVVLLAKELGYSKPKTKS